MWNKKKKFYKMLEPYFQQGLVREIYSSNDACVLSVGEIYYVVCPYLIIDNIPLGLKLSQDHIKEVIEDKELFDLVIENVFNDFDKKKDMVFPFSKGDLESYKEWIKECKTDGISEVDYNFEEELAQMSKGKSR